MNKKNTALPKRKSRVSDSKKQDGFQRAPTMTALQKALSKRFEALLQYLQQHLPKSELSLEEALHPQHCRMAPDDLDTSPLLDDAIALVMARKEDLLTEMASEICVAVEVLIEPKQQSAILGRAELTDQWPWPQSMKAGGTLNLLMACCEALPKCELLWGWPGVINPTEVLSWAQKVLERSKEGQFEELKQLAKRSFLLSEVQLTNPKGKPFVLSFAGMALVFLAKDSLENGLKRHVIAIDATKEHHELLSHWRDFPKRKEQITRKAEDGRLLLFDPKEGPKPNVQMAMPISEEGLDATTVHFLRRLLGGEGLRHWAALQSQLSLEGGREGWIRWTLDGHMQALGYKERSQYDPALKEQIAKQVELLTQLEFVIYNKDGTIRARRPFLLVGTTYERLQDSKWKLDGMELRINPWLYEGVRNSETGELGRMWYPVPAEIAQVDPRQFPYALILAFLLSNRFRWDLDKPEKTDLPITGKKLLELGNIPLDPEHPSRAWESLENNLEELHRIGQLAPIRWKGEPYSNRGICLLRPADWILDRVKYGLTPQEEPPSSLPLTGKEFLAWRKEKDITQVEAAELLKVGLRTIKRAEALPDVTLSKNVQSALKKWKESQKDEEDTIIWITI